jgi:hypothetical protein
MGRKKVGTLGRAPMLILCGGLAASAALTASRASAQAAAPPAEIVVTLSAEDKPLFVELYHPRAKVGTDPPIARCRTPCFARLSPGRYRLFVHETEDTLSGGRIVDLDQSTAIVVSPDHDSQRSTGLALGIAGPVVTIVGAVLILSSLCWGESDTTSTTGTQTCADHSNNVGPGIVLMLGGLAITPVGWVMFGKSFKPDLTLTPLSQHALGERRAVALPGGFRLGMTVEF